jgi:hypothetical protein
VADATWDELLLFVVGAVGRDVEIPVLGFVITGCETLGGAACRGCAVALLGFAAVVSTITMSSVPIATVSWAILTILSQLTIPTPVLLLINSISL